MKSRMRVVEQTLRCVPRTLTGTSNKTPVRLDVDLVVWSKAPVCL